MTGLVHLRYLYPDGEGYSVPAICGHLPERWRKCPPPAKADAMCGACLAVRARWYRLRRLRACGTNSHPMIPFRALGGPR